MFPAIAYVLACTFLLTLPGSAIPKDNWFDRLWMDKWVHAGMFFVLVFLWCRLLRKKQVQSVKGFVIITLLCTLYGIAMEFVQHHWVPHRSYDPGDMIADAIGSAGGLVFSIGRYIKK